MSSLFRISTLALPIALTFSFAAAPGCNDPAADEPKAEVAEAKMPAVEAAPAPEPVKAAAGGFSFSNEGSTIGFTGSKVTGSHDGTFAKFMGSVGIPNGDATQGTVQVEISMGSLGIQPEKLTGHLLSPDFFDVAKFPTSSFKSTSVTAGGAGGTHTITGDLTLHGVTKSITFPATVKMAANGVEVDAQFSINRKDFGIVYPGMPDDLIRDDVVIRLDINAGNTKEG